MKSHVIFINTIIALLISACSPIPIKYECNQVRFEQLPEIQETSYFDNSGIFSGYCPDKTANQIELSLSSGHKFNIKIEREWIRVQPATKEQRKITITSPNTIAKTDAKGVTHVRVLDGSVQPLENDFIDLKFGEIEELRLMLEYSKCVCVTYDEL